ncbi:PilZ domain-containing protein [Sphingomonas ginkgonis]|nr:PilZ domain-containing protein [Sphingomonas ginkgonis]
MIRARIAEDRGGPERRRSERLPVDIEAKLRELGTAGSEARVVNISETGFMAEVDEDFEVGARVWLMLPGRERANAVVRWTAAGKLGAEFTDPLPADSLPPSAD